MLLVLVEKFKAHLVMIQRKSANPYARVKSSSTLGQARNTAQGAPSPGATTCTQLRVRLISRRLPVSHGAKASGLSLLVLPSVLKFSTGKQIYFKFK